LPIYAVEEQIVTQLKQTRRLMLQALTGSSEFTQVQQILLTDGFLANGYLATPQTRRVALVVQRSSARGSSR